MAKIVVVGGGTGGHITPALAVADYLRTRGHTLFYMGNANSLESQMATSKGFPFYSLVFSGMPRQPSIRWFIWLGQLRQAIAVAKAHLLHLQVDVVFGTGGYVAAPVLLAAKLLNIPYMIHEADAQPGLVNRLTSRWAQTVSTAFQQQILRHPHIVVTGNPVKPGLGLLTQAEACQQLKPDWLETLTHGLPVVLVMGGSQGARRINQAVIEALQALLPHCLLVHQTGGKLFEESKASVPVHLWEHPHYWPLAFIDDMPAMLALASVVVCRAGSLTLSELFVAGLPAILIPYPYAAANHQLKNALAVQQAGAAWLIEDRNLTSQCLVEKLTQLLHSSSEQLQMRDNMRKLAKPFATRDIAEHLLQLTKPSRPSDSQECYNPIK